MNKIAISDAKANRLYWLGRYTERAYLSLHMLRRYFDLYLDGDPVDFATYAKNLGPAQAKDMDFKTFASVYIFDKKNPSSIVSSLTGANDNAILLREVIKSESLSYIQMSVCALERLAQREDEITVNELQEITDHLLSFFGSIEERLYSDKAVAIIRYGRFIESLDMHMRFNYDFEVVREVFDSLLHWVDIDESVINKYSMEKFDVMLNESAYELNDSVYKTQMLGILNKLVNL